MSGTDFRAHVLLIEDEDNVREIVTYLLEALGFSVTACASGQDGVGAYREEWQSIDLIMLDLLMPVMDGEETFRQLKAINPDLVVLISSGFGLEDKAQKLLDEGARGFIQKPYRKDPLFEMIKKLLPHVVDSPAQECAV